MTTKGLQHDNDGLGVRNDDELRSFFGQRNQNSFRCLAEYDTVNKLNNGLVEIDHAVELFQSHRKNKTQKLSEHTLILITDRSEMILQLSVDMSKYGRRNKQLSLVHATRFASFKY